MDKRVRCVDARPDPYMGTIEIYRQKGNGDQGPRREVISPSYIPPFIAMLIELDGWLVPSEFVAVTVQL
jgi:hypothetical protein